MKKHGTEIKIELRNFKSAKALKGAVQIIELLFLLHLPKIKDGQISFTNERKFNLPREFYTQGGIPVLKTRRTRKGRER